MGKNGLFTILAKIGKYVDISLLYCTFYKIIKSNCTLLLLLEWQCLAISMIIDMTALNNNIVYSLQEREVDIK